MLPTPPKWERTKDPFRSWFEDFEMWQEGTTVPLEKQAGLLYFHALTPGSMKRSLVRRMPAAERKDVNMVRKLLLEEFGEGDLHCLRLLLNPRVVSLRVLEEPHSHPVQYRTREGVDGLVALCSPAKLGDERRSVVCDCSSDDFTCIVEGFSPCPMTFPRGAVVHLLACPEPPDHEGTCHGPGQHAPAA